MTRRPNRRTWLIGHTLWIPLLVFDWGFPGGAWSWIVVRALFKGRRARRRTLNTRCRGCGTTSAYAGVGDVRSAGLPFEDKCSPTDAKRRLLS